MGLRAQIPPCRNVKKMSCFMQARSHLEEGRALPPSNSLRLYIEALYSALFTHFSIVFYQI